MPAGPWLLWLAEAKLNAKVLHHCTVEAVRSFEVADAHKDMREHLASSLAGMPTDGIAVQVPSVRCRAILRFVEETAPTPIFLKPRSDCAAVAIERAGDSAPRLQKRPILS
jgi:hypothetical protein